MKGEADYEDIKYFFDNYMESLSNFKLILNTFCLNDAGDILIRMKPSDKHIKQVLKQQKNL